MKRGTGSGIQGRGQRLEATSRPRPPKVRKRPDATAVQDSAHDGGADRSSVLRGEWVQRAAITVPEIKQAISFRVDPDVLGFFKAQGPRYQTRMNAVLRAYMTAHGGEEK